MSRAARTVAAFRSATAGFALLLAASAVVAASPVEPVSPVAAVGPLSRQAAISSALVQAASSGTQTEVMSARTYHSQLFAVPNGQLMEQMSTVPLFGRDASGQLVPVDTTLSQGSGGISPAATALSTVFPVGGGKAIQLESGGVGLTMSLPEALPAPTLDGSTATYPDVYPGVDLQLTATADGIRQVLVVKDEAAASDPQLSQLTFSFASDTGTLAESAGGTMSVLSPGGTAVMSTGTPQMWDSSSTALLKSSGSTSSIAPNSTTSTTSPTATATSGTQSISTSPGDTNATQPEDGDRIVPVDSAIAGHRMSLSPSTQFLGSAKTVYPVYIDPSPNLNQGARLRVGSAVIGAQWQFTGDGGVGRCPISYDSSCKADHIERLFYQYTRSGLTSGDHIVKAEFRADEDWSANCTKHKVVLNQTGAITSSTKWPGPKVTKSVQTVSAAHGHDSSCPEAKVEFSNAALTSLAQSLANGSIAKLTLGLKAADETDQTAWKRFKPGAVLQVWYVAKPAIPTHWGYQGTGTSGTQCSTDSSDPTTTDTWRPKFQAKLATAANATSPGELQARFEVQGKVSGGTYDDVWSSPNTRDNGSWKPDGEFVSYTPSSGDALPAGDAHFRVRVKGLSHYEDVPDVPDGTLQSSWSSWCYFDVDLDGPVAPVVTATGTDSAATACEAAIQTHPADELPTCEDLTGEPLTFKFGVDPNDTDPNPDHYAAKPSSTTLATVTQSGSQQQFATVTPRVPGHFVLDVTLFDTNNRPSDKTAIEIVYDPPASLAEWDVTSADSTVAVVNNGLTTSGGSMTLTGDAALSDPDGGRSGNVRDDTGALTDEAITFQGSGQAASGSAPVDTGLSFTVGGWAMLTSGATDQTVFSEVSSDGLTGLEVRYVAASNSWLAEWHYVSSGTPHVAVTPLSAPAVLNAWTSLIVSYDASPGTLTLFVNGVPTNGSSSALTLSGAQVPTTVSAPLVLGHAGPAGTTSPTAGFHGRIDQIQVWNRAMGSVEAYGNAIHPFDRDEAYLSRVADWNAAYATTTSIGDVSDFNRPALALVGGASVDTTSDSPVVTLDGASGDLEVTGPIVDGTAAFTVNVDMAPNIAAMTGSDTSYRITGQRGGSSGPDSSWALWFERTAINPDGTVQGYFKFGSWSSPTSGATAGGDSVDELVTLDGSEFNVTAAYRPQDEAEPDPEAMNLSVFVNLQGSDGVTRVGQTAFSAPAQGAGAFTVGKAWRSGAWADWLPADISEVTVFAGGASDDEIPNLADWSDGGVQ